MCRSILRATLMAAILAVLSTSLMAQQSGSVVGTVADKNGAFITNAEVTLTNAATKDVRHATTNSDGFFAFSGTAVGDYSVKVESQGFRVAEQTGIHVSPGDRRNLNVTLAVAAATESITVTADVSAIVVDSGDLSSTLNAKDIRNLSLQGRDVTELLKTLPGFSNTTGMQNKAGYDSTITSIGSAVGNNISAPGVSNRSGGADLVSDGAHVLDPGCACNATQTVNADMVSEVKVSTSAYSADGATGPVVVSAVGKSGTDTYHGMAYMHFRDHVMNSNDWDANEVHVARPNDRYMYPGGQFQGPVPFTHKKLLFFAGYEYYNQSFPDNSGEAGGILKADLPTLSERAGHFDHTLTDNAAVCNSISANWTASYRCSDFTSISTDAGTVSNIVNNDISAHIAPGAKAMMKIIPEPNYTPTASDPYNYVHLLINTNNGYMFHTKVDYNISDETKLAVSYNQQHENYGSPMMRWWYTSNEISSPGDLATSNMSRTISGSLVKVFSATTTNEVIAGLAYMNAPNTLKNPSAFDRTALGYPYLYPGTSSAPVSSMPSITNGWYQNDFGIPQMMDTDRASYFSRKMLPGVSDNFTKVMGRHSVKAGASWTRSGNRQATVDQGTGKNGTLNYSPIWDSNGSSLNPVVDLMLDHPNSLNYKTNSIQDMAETSFGFYGQDEWKVNRRLTVNFGLRVQHETPWVDTTGKTGSAAFKKEWYDADIAAGDAPLPGLRWHGMDSTISMAGHSLDSFNYGPRFGVAYDLDGAGKTVLRGGFGSYYYHDGLNGYDSATSTAQGATSCGTTGSSFLSQTDTGGSYVKCANSAAGVGGITAVDPTDHVEPYTYTYNFTVSRQLMAKSLLEITYNGSQSMDLNVPQTDINVTPIGAYAQRAPDPYDTTYFNTFISIHDIANSDFKGSQGNQVKQDFKPYPRYKNVNIIRHGSSANYNALMVTWQKHQGALNFNLNYTWSKALGYGTTPDPVNFKNDYGILGQDRTHVFNSSYSYEVGKRFKNNKVEGALLNNWMISGITVLQSGVPIHQQSSNLNFGGTTTQSQIGGNDYNQIDNTHFLGADGDTKYTLEPILTCDPSKGNPRSYRRFINPNCFALPTPPTFDSNGVMTHVGGQGQYQWPYLKGPKYFSSDLSLSRTFGVSEHRNLQFKLTGMNFLNHALWSFDNNNSGNYSLNYVSSVLTTANTSAGWDLGVPNVKFGRRVLELTMKYNF